MRIISKFHDYYDRGMSLGEDSRLIYMRTSREVECPLDHLSWRGSEYRDIVLDRRLVGFCGKVYPLLIATKPTFYGKSSKRFCYSMDDLDRFVADNYSTKETAKYSEQKPRKWSRHSRRWSDFLRRFSIAGYFIKPEWQTNWYAEQFASHRCPAFVVRPGNSWGKRPVVTLNARLADVEFYRVFDAFTAFQEISMFLGGMAEPEKEIPAISDKTMAEIKGFDKWSFRKEPAAR